MSKNAEQIKQLEDQIAKLKAEDDAFSALSEDEQMAITLHEMLCRHNHHMDGCGWGYEFVNRQHDWSGYEHGVYMQKALMLRGFCRECGLSTKTALDLFTLIRGH